MSNIPLHPTRALDPHLTYCPKCGGDGKGLTVGHLFAFVDRQDRIVCCYNRGDREKTKRSNHGHLDGYDTREVREGERVPDNQICDTCEKEAAEHRAIVEAGGVYFKCDQCHQTGVIKDSEFAKDVRKRAGVEAPNPIGVKFESCDQHATG